jgi:hypothetical protein
VIERLTIAPSREESARGKEIVRETRAERRMDKVYFLLFFIEREGSQAAAVE